MTDLETKVILGGLCLYLLAWVSDVIFRILLKETR